MQLLDEINANVAANAAEAEYLGVVERLKKKYKSLLPKDCVGKTVDRVIHSSDSIVTIFTDKTFLYGYFSEDYDGCDEVLFIDPTPDFVAGQNLMEPADKEALEQANAYFQNKSKSAEDHRLLHQVKSRFSPEKLKELFGC